MTIVTRRLPLSSVAVLSGMLFIGQHASGQTTMAARVETGKLSTSDDTLDSGEYFDVYQIDATAGQRYVINLSSDSFDTYLMVRNDADPDLTLDNDDHDGDVTSSQVILETDRDGIYNVLVTSFEAGETGAYRLTISEPAQTTPGTVHLDEQGALAADDSKLDGGEFFDRFVVTLNDGEAVTIDLVSEEFDAYLLVQHADDPDFQLDNDDFSTDTTDSRITMTAPRPGDYEVIVTSFEAGETGAYRVTVSSSSRPSSGGSVELDEQGALATGDQKLDGGEYFDSYSITLDQGGAVEFNLTSEDFDTYLLIRHADDDDFQLENDDRDGDSTDSRIRMSAASPGTYEILVTSFDAGETGAYRLTAARTGSEGVLREETGELAKGDEELDSGEYYDTYEIDANAGESYIVDLYSDDFDTYLIIDSAENDKFVLENDDFNGDTSHSQVRIVAPETGTYQVHATTFEPGESGPYRLTVRASSFDPVTRSESGELEFGDATLDGGEYRDTYQFEGRAGQHVRIELHSDEFDTYLLLRDPAGEVHENDDFNGQTSQSVIEFGLTEPGEYTVTVTSYDKGETGAYELLIHFDQPTTGTLIRDRTALPENGSLPGSLSPADDTLDARYADFYSATLVAGKRAIIRMKSEDFDTVLLLTYPDGTEVEFDDEFGDLNAAIDLIPEESGEYYVTATSYDSDVEGNYTLEVTLDAPGRPVGRRGNISVTPDQRILGVFVGIGDYEEDENDLQFCDRDAEFLHGILQREFNLRSADSVLLTNEQATRDAVTTALQEIGSRAGPDDLLIFFFSGHGDQRAGNEDAFDPDGIHETISLYDGELLDDDLADLVNRSAAGISLAAIDACFSGGFAKDVVSARGRMGVFSSEEDVLSVVPGRFRAGGYLSRFLAEAVSERRHDSDHNDDGCLTAHELSHFLEERYLQEVRSAKDAPKLDDEFVDPEENLSFQRIVIDRGGLGHDQVLFCWE